MIDPDQEVIQAHHVRTYVSRKNAIRALQLVVDEVCTDYEQNQVHWLIASCSDGRFAPAVEMSFPLSLAGKFVQRGITVIGE